MVWDKIKNMVQSEKDFYGEYLKSAEWKEIRKAVMERGVTFNKFESKCSKKSKLKLSEIGSL